jgi:hypothetical protein
MADFITEGCPENLRDSMIQISSQLPVFERLILQKLLLSAAVGNSDSLSKDLLLITSASTNVDTSKRIIAKVVSTYAYQECYSLFSNIFKNFTSEISKELAKNNVRRLDTINDTDEAKKLGSKVYGEIEFYSFCNLLERIDIKENETFYDLGHGTGKAMVCKEWYAT